MEKDSYLNLQELRDERRWTNAPEARREPDLLVPGSTFGIRFRRYPDLLHYLRLCWSAVPRNELTWSEPTEVRNRLTDIKDGVTAFLRDAEESLERKVYFGRRGGWGWPRWIW